MRLALEFLGTMELPSGVFCFERRRGEAEGRGRSIRYSLMACLGLARARTAGYDHAFDVESLYAAALRELDAPELVPGDLGLYLWVDARLGGARREELGIRLRRGLAERGGLDAREGMELAWIILGLAAHDDASRAETQLLHAAVELLLGHNSAPSGLFYHSGGRGRRRRFPNFATEIYSILALASAGRRGSDGPALSSARRAADRLLALQLADGGWPWLYDAETGRVVERYELYSVHQHAMAPMALIELFEATGERRYAEAAGRGLRWIDGPNELGVRMVDEEERLIYRSVRRRGPWDRALLYANTASAWVIRRPLMHAGAGTELNATCRPYELGWLCEAWAGREDVLVGGGSNQP